MNTQLNAMPESAAAQPIAPATTSPSQSFYWSIRRELWEHRSLYIAPSVVALVFLFGYLVGFIHRPVVSGISPMQKQVLETGPYDFAALLLMGTTLLVAVFYCLDALYGERRDRSILFWKSLPVSDFTAVLSKASIPVLVLPLITFVITVATHWLMLLESSVARLATGANIADIWSVPFFQIWQMLLYHLVAMHGFYYAPFYGWLLLVSAFARRAPILWAALPVVAIAAIEKIAFGSANFLTTLGQRFAGNGGGGDMMHPPTLLGIGRFLIDPSLWIGLAIFAACLAGAIRLRRSQGPI